MQFQMSEKIDQLLKSLAKAQAKFPHIPKRGENKFHKKSDGKPSTYVILDDLLDIVKPILLENDLILSQFPVSDSDYVGVKTVLAHTSGQFISGTMMIRLEKLGPQEAGKVITYLRRYEAGAILGLSTEEDDDADSITQPPQKKYEPTNVGGPAQTYRNSEHAPKPNPAKAGEPISEAQAKRLFAICKSKGWTTNELKEALHVGWGITSSKEILRASYEDVCKMVESTSPAEAIELLKLEKSQAPQGNETQSFDMGDIPF